MTRGEAIALAESGVWKLWTDDQIVQFQLYEDFLAMDFGRFQEAVEKCLGRSVWTHEFAKPESLQAEYEKRIPRASFEDVLGKIPAGKPVILVRVDEEP